MSSQVPRRTHYVARHYLAGWFGTDGTERLWVYHRGPGKPFLGGVDQVGLIRFFFPPDVERLLDKKVDHPGSIVIAKIRNGEPITLADKATLAYYMAVQLKRVPRFRDWAKSKIPHELAKYEESVFADIQKIVDDDPSALEDAERFRAEVSKVFERYRVGIPDSLMEKIKLPWPSRRVTEAILGMTWRFVTTDDANPFVTSDNPVSLFTWLGVASQDSEIAFPISKTCCLHASWTHGDDCSYLPAERQVLLEMNRRTIYGSNRFIFSSSSADWIQSSTQKKRFELKRITWSPYTQRSVQTRSWSWPDQEWDPSLKPPPWYAMNDDEDKP